MRGIVARVECKRGFSNNVSETRNGGTSRLKLVQEFPRVPEFDSD